MFEHSMSGCKGAMLEFNTPTTRYPNRHRLRFLVQGRKELRPQLVATPRIHRLEGIPIPFGVEGKSDLFSFSITFGEF